MYIIIFIKYYKTFWTLLSSKSILPTWEILYFIFKVNNQKHRHFL